MPTVEEFIQNHDAAIKASKTAWDKLTTKDDAPFEHREAFQRAYVDAVAVVKEAFAREFTATNTGPINHRANKEAWGKVMEAVTGQAPSRDGFDR